MNNKGAASLVVIAAAAISITVALSNAAGPTPGPGGIPYVFHNDSLAGSGTKTIPLIINLMPDGGLEYTPDGGIQLSTGLVGLFNGAGGSVAVSQTSCVVPCSSPAWATVNLTTTGTTDWYTNDTTSGFANRKVAGSGAIHPPIAVAGGGGSFINSSSSTDFTVSWSASDATGSRPTSGPIGWTQSACYAPFGGCPSGNGWSFVVEAKTTQQVFRQYVEMGGGQTTFNCVGTMTDGSGTATTTTLNSSSSGPYFLALLEWTFTGANVNSQLQVYCRSIAASTTGASSATVLWMALALSPT